jgi:hypothetical protein
MVHLLIFIFCLNTSADSLIQETAPVNQKSYTKQVLINGLVGIGFGVSTGIFHALGKNSYNEYLLSDSIRTALDSWNKTKRYDNIRNVCAVGAFIFTLRALYFQLKHVKASRSTKHTPTLDFQYSFRNKWTLGIKTIF